MTHIAVSPIAAVEDKLQRLIDRLGFDLASGQLHLWLGAGLADDLGKKPNALALAPHFWFFTMKAHGDAAVLTLARLFDKKKRTASLHALLTCAGETAGLFTAHSASEVRKLVEEQCQIIAELKDRLAPIKQRRDKVLAHLEAASNPSDCTVGLDDMRDLYEKAREVLNTVSTAYKGKKAILYWSPERDLLWNDYRNILG